LSWSRPDELPQRTALRDEFGQLIERIDLSVGRLQYPLEVWWPMREPPAIDDCDYLPPFALAAFVLIAAQGLDARSLVAGGSVVFGQLGLDDDLGEFGVTWNQEVRRLFEARHLLSVARGAAIDVLLCEQLLDGVLDEFADDVAYAVAVGRVRTAQHPLVQQLRIRDRPTFEEPLHRRLPLLRVDLVEAMHFVLGHGRTRAADDIGEEGHDGADQMIALALICETRLALAEHEPLTSPSGCVQVTRVCLLHILEEGASRFGLLDRHPRSLPGREADDAAQHRPSPRLLSDRPEDSLPAEVRTIAGRLPERLVSLLEVVPLAKRAAARHLDEEALERVEHSVGTLDVLRGDAWKRTYRLGLSPAVFTAVCSALPPYHRLEWICRHGRHPRIRGRRCTSRGRRALRPQNDRNARLAATLRSGRPSNSSEHRQTAAPLSQCFREFSPVFAAIRRSTKYR